MDCTIVRTALSASLDGEDPGLDPAALDRHLAGCAACRAHRSEIADLQRAFRVTPAPPVPDLTPRILAAVAAEEQASRRAPRAPRELRLALVAVALVQLAVALPALLLGDDGGATVHAARHLGSFGLAVAVGLLCVAWRPSLAAGMVPVVAAFVLASMGATFADVLGGRASLSQELVHVPDLVGLTLLALVVRPWRRTPRRLEGVATA